MAASQICRCKLCGEAAVGELGHISTWMGEHQRETGHNEFLMGSTR